jgi:hypothetical protein
VSISKSLCTPQSIKEPRFASSQENCPRSEGAAQLFAVFQHGERRSNEQDKHGHFDGNQTAYGQESVEDRNRAKSMPDAKRKRQKINHKLFDYNFPLTWLDRENHKRFATQKQN